MNYNTITLNPAIDRTVYLDTLTDGELNRSTASVTMAGGKGINVSRMLNILGAETIAFTFIGGNSGKLLQAFLDEEGITHSAVQTNAETRQNIKIIESSDRCTEINSAGGPVTKQELQAMLDNIENAAKKDDMWIIAGSCPQGVDKSVYNIIVSLLKTKGCKTALDCDGEALKIGLKARPALIKPNLRELEGLVGKPLKTQKDIVEAAACVYVENSVEVVCTLGDKGALYVGDEGKFLTDTPKVKVKGFAGAGDTFLAGFLCMRGRGMPVENSLAFAAAAAAAKVELPCSAAPDIKQIEKYIDRKITRLY